MLCCYIPFGFLGVLSLAIYCRFISFGLRCTVGKSCNKCSPTCSGITVCITRGRPFARTSPRSARPSVRVCWLPGRTHWLAVQTNWLAGWMDGWTKNESRNPVIQTKKKLSEPTKLTVSPFTWRKWSSSSRRKLTS